MKINQILHIVKQKTIQIQTLRMKYHQVMKKFLNLKRFDISLIYIT